MGQFGVSVDVALIAWACMVGSHCIGAVGIVSKRKFIRLIAYLILIASVSVMPLVWSLPSLYLCVLWRPPFEHHAIWKVLYYFLGIGVVLCIFMSQSPTIDPKSDGERSSQSFVYIGMPDTTVASVLGSVVGLCVSFGTVVNIHKHHEVWTCNIARITSTVFLLSGLQRMIGSGLKTFKSTTDNFVFMFLFMSGIGLFAVSLRYHRGDGRQPMIQGPGIIVASFTGLFISIVMDGTVIFFEAYQWIFTSLSWVLCVIMFSMYIRRYEPIDRFGINPIRHLFEHWLVQF